MAEVSSIERVDIDKLIPYVNNAKIHSDEQVTKIAASIREFGFLSPVLIDREFNIIAGHGRILAAKKLELKDAPCVFVEGLTEAQKKAYILADNRIGELAEWDMDLVNAEIEQLLEQDFDIDLTGFDYEPPTEENEVVEDDFEMELPEDPKAKLGDIYQLGNSRLMCGDSFLENDIKKLLNGSKIGLLLTDPPYGIDYGGMLKGKGDGKGGADKNGWKSYDAPTWDTKRPDMSAFDYMRCISENQIIWGGNYFADLLPPKMCWLVWDKGQRDFSLADGELAWTSFDKALRIKTYSRASANKEEKIHLTQKPLKLLQWCIEVAEKNKANTETILDLFGGSGSTLITCEQLKRKCFMMELDPKYVDLIIDRWEKFTGKKAVLLNE